MKFEIGDRVMFYGREGTIVDKNPATRRYLVEFEKEQVTNPVWESELTKIEPSSTT